ncbi:MAG: oligoendopeptidase F [Acidobacteriota bacterium]|jgi:oligoendopeptidase F
MKRTPAVLMTLILLVSIGPIGASSAAEEKLFYESRSEIPQGYRWDLGIIFPDLEAWETAYARVEARLPELAALKGHLGESDDLLLDAVELLYGIQRTLDDLTVYASQWQSTDTRDTAANSYEGKARALGARFAETAAFIEPEIVQLPQAAIDRIRDDPRFDTYEHVLDNILRTREHTRSPEVEEVLAGSALLQASPGQTYGFLTNADIAWPTIQDENGEERKVIPGLFYTFMANEDRRVRRDAALALFGTLDAYGNTYSGTYGGLVHKDVWLAKNRLYPSTLDMELDRTNVPRSVVETLVETVHDNLDAVHGYVELRKKVLGLEDVHIYDLYVSMVPEAKKTYTFDEGWALAMEFWKETFGEEYAAVAERGRAERWIDVYPSAGKQGGAYSWGTYNSVPYLFLNWGGTLEDVSTLVHEMGHSIHSYLANTNQPYHLADYSLFVAEVGSVASESLFFEWLLDRTEDPTLRLALLNQRMNDIVGTFLRQIFFHEFEHAAHVLAEEGQPLTKESLGKVWSDLWLEYYGNGAALDEEFKGGWARIPHFYRTYYVWVYATSFAAGEAIAARVRAGDETAVQDYLATLKLGGSVYPMEALKRAGVDMTDPEVIRAVMDRFRSIQGEMETLLLKE